MKKLTKAIAAIMLMTAAMFAAGCTPEENNNTDVKVTTYTPQDVTANTAVCGGDVIVPQGLTLYEFGVCWSENPNPTVEDSYLSTSYWSEPYVCITGLEPDTKYHVRAYALCGFEFYYGEDKSFTTESNSGGGGGNGTYNGHDYVDLGLPSGTLWATYNVGATIPEGYGDYFNYSAYEDPAADNWGNGWCMPTKEQWEELYQNTTNTWTTENGVSGRLFTASNGYSLFLPAAGGYWSGVLNEVGSYGFYWSSSNTALPGAYFAWYYIFNSDTNSMHYGNYFHLSLFVRAVRSAT